MGEKKVGKKGEEEVKAGDGAGGGSIGAVSTTVVLNVKLHCEGCAEKVKKALKHLNGVESVKADHKTNKLIVTGKVEAEALKERVELKTKKKVELVSPQPAAKKANHGGARGGGVDSPNYDDKLDKKPKKAEEEDKAEEIKHQVTTVVFKTRVHCDGCAHKINKILHKYQGVEEASVDLAKDQITIKGTMDLNEMLPYLNLKLKRVVEIAPPPAPKKPDGETKPKGSPNVGETLKGDGGVKPTIDNSGRGVLKKGKEVAKSITDGGSDEDTKVVAKLAINAKPMEENVSKIEVVNKMEYSGGYPYGYGAYTYSYDPHQTPPENGFVSEYWHAPPYMHAPEMFSDDNPNGCSLM